MNNSVPYPVTIIADRYNGTFSWGTWLAFNQYAHALPDEVSGGDNECHDFWWKYRAGGYLDSPIGIGATPHEAYENLITKLEHTST